MILSLQLAQILAEGGDLDAAAIVLRGASERIDASRSAKALGIAPNLAKILIAAGHVDQAKKLLAEQRPSSEAVEIRRCLLFMTRYRSAPMSGLAIWPKRALPLMRSGLVIRPIAARSRLHIPVDPDQRASGLFLGCDWALARA